MFGVSFSVGFRTTRRLLQLWNLAGIVTALYVSCVYLQYLTLLYLPNALYVSCGYLQYLTLLYLLLAMLPCYYYYGNYSL
jgi:hypothetical protein